MLPQQGMTSGTSASSSISGTEHVNFQEIVSSLHNENAIESALYKDASNVITDRLEFGITVDAILVKPNVEGSNDTVVEKICNAVNENGVSMLRSALGTTVIDQGTIRVVMHNGRVEVCGPGKFYCGCDEIFNTYFWIFFQISCCCDDYFYHYNLH